MDDGRVGIRARKTDAALKDIRHLGLVRRRVKYIETTLCNDPHCGTDRHVGRLHFRVITDLDVSFMVTLHQNALIVTIINIKPPEGGNYFARICQYLRAVAIFRGGLGL